MLQGIGLDPCRQILLWRAGLIERPRGWTGLFEFSGHYPTTGAALSGRWGRSEVAGKYNRCGWHEGNSVALLGKLDTPELWFGISDAFLFTSYCETFGLVLLRRRQANYQSWLFHVKVAESKF